MHPAGPAQAPPQSAPVAQPAPVAAPVSSFAVPVISPAGGSFGGSAASSSPVARAHSPSQQPVQARPNSSSQPNYAYGQQPPNAQPPSPYVPQPYVQQAPVSHANNSHPATQQPGAQSQPVTQQPGAQSQPAAQPQLGGAYPGAQSQPGGAYPGAQSQPGGSYPDAKSQHPGGSYPGAQPGPGGSYPDAQSQHGSYPGAQPGPGGSYPNAPSQQPGGSYPGAQAGAPYPNVRPATGPQSHAAGQPRAGSQSAAPAYFPGGYPIHTPAPDSVHAPEPPAPAKKSKRGLAIGLVAVGAIGAGVAIAVAMSGGKGSKGGAESKEAVTADTLAALTKPDVDALVALAPESERDIMECTEVGEQDRDPPAKTLEKLREALTKKADTAAGLAVELVKLGDGKTTKMEKGKEVNKGCLLTTDVALHDHELVLKVKQGDKPAKERTARIGLMEVDGRWYLSSPPRIVRPGDCATAAKASIKINDATWKKSSLGDAAKARLEKAMLQHCTDDG
nr:hypothetical protein [Deltaproteobacteria bacterium]